MKKYFYAVLKPVAVLAVLFFAGCGQQPTSAMNNNNNWNNQNGQYYMDSYGRCMSTYGQQVSTSLCQNNWNNNGNWNNNQNGQYYYNGNQCYSRTNNMPVNPSLCQNTGGNWNTGGQQCTGIMYMYGSGNQLVQVNCSLLTCSGYSLLNAQGQTVYCM